MLVGGGEGVGCLCQGQCNNHEILRLDIDVEHYSKVNYCHLDMAPYNRPYPTMGPYPIRMFFFCIYDQCSLQQ